MNIRTPLALLAAGSLGVALLAASPTQAVATKSYAFTIASSARTVTLGGAVKLTGTVKPSTVGSALVVQQKAGSTWNKIRTIQTAAGSTFAVSVRPAAAGTATYRVCKAGAGAYRTTCSAPVGVGVYRWHYLTDFDAADSNGYINETAVAINGNSYARGLRDSYIGQSIHYREYNLNRRCSTLTGVYGLSDTSRSGSQARVAVLADGNLKFEQVFSLGTAVSRSINVSTYLRVRYETSGISNGTGSFGVGAVGNPRVLCRF